MACSKLTVVESIRDDFLTCRICFEVFTDPKILPCLHTYCFQCICSHVDTSQTEGRPVVCPECREPCPQEVSKLKTNFFINGLSDVLKEKSKDVPCTTCCLQGRECQAEVKCLDCGDLLCSRCGSGHNASSVTWDHKTVSLEDIKKGTYDDTLRRFQKIHCPNHVEKEVEFFCLSCNACICITCVILDHQGHQCKTISDVVHDKKTSLTILTENLRDKLLVAEKEEQKISTELTQLRSAEKLERSKIEEQAEREMEEIRTRMTISLNNLRASYKLKQDEVELVVTEVKSHTAVLKSCVKFCDELLKKGKDGELLMLESLLEERLSHLNQLNIPVRSVEKSAKAITSLRSETIKDATPQTNTPIKGDRKIQLKKIKDFSTNTEHNAHFPDVKDMVYSSEVGLVVTDKANGKIQIFSPSGELVKEFTHSDLKPRALAIIGTTIATISKKYLHIFSKNGKLRSKNEVTEKAPNDGFCFTLSLAGSEAIGFIVGNIPGSSDLKIYDTNGCLIRTLSRIVTMPLASLSVTPKGEIVLAEWGCGRLRVITPEGKEVFCIKEANWKPNGTCVSPDGTIFVADYDWHSVGVYDSIGEHRLDYSTKKDGVKKPVAVAVKGNDVLFVTGTDGKVSMYNIIKK